MSSIVCQGSQPCLEPRLIPKSNPSKSFPQHQEEQQENSHNKGESGVWSFIHSLTNDARNHKESIETEKIYVHPLAKRSASSLSMKSLEMCTESLGSETGSEKSDEFSPPPSSKIKNYNAIRKLKLIPSRSFPPPLNSISGLDSVRVRPHREDGRLVIKAFRVGSSDCCFRAERGDGRLRLCLVNNSLGYDNEEANESETRVYGDDDDGEDGGDDVDDEWVEDVRGNGGYEIQIGEVQRPSRCKEDGVRRNKEMPSRGPFLKALC